MAGFVVDQYAVWVKPNQAYYRIALRDKVTGTVHQREVASPEELRVIVDLLRNESPCWYDPATNLLTAGFEPVGEGES